MGKVAIYARYSCEQQRETSIDDQLRRCREVSQRYNIALDNLIVFSDSALSGTSKHLDKRDGYTALIKAWEAGEISVIIVDDFSRLSRDGVEQALLIRRLESNLRVRLLTATGIDTNQNGWQLQLGLLGVVGQQAIRETQHLVVRGMVGQLERGYMIATPPYGYVLDRQFDGAGNRIGTNWKISQPEADIVEEIFQHRADGQSMHQIARWLNEADIPLQRKAQKIDGGFWRASRIRVLLTNTIYRGEFTTNSSYPVRARAKKSGKELIVRVFPRPELRIVSDEIWHRCNGKTISRSGYGGGKHALSGLIGCGCCGGTLVLTSKTRCRSVYCASCTTAKSMTGETERLTSTVATAGIHILLKEVLHLLLTPAFIAHFKERIRDMLTGDYRHEIEQMETEISQLKRAQVRLSKILVATDKEDSILEARYQEARQKCAQAELKLSELNKAMPAVDEAAMEAQLNIDPSEILDGLFDEDIPPEKLRSVLSRLFPEITFEGKIGRYRSYFRIGFAFGEALALASETAAVIGEMIVHRFELRYMPDNTKVRLNPWSVSLITDDEIEMLESDADLGEDESDFNPAVLSNDTSDVELLSMGSRG